ncbi:MAG: polysaccharide deacetylase family protein [Myxococcales bacterium]|nr:polysaccharide deacetylase family protein [Myxococcales bacterium]
MAGMQSKATILSVDLDDVACYHAIHGLPPPSDRAARIVLERCLPRFIELFDEVAATATFFVVGRDLERDLQSGGRGAALLRQAAKGGCELANHSHSHPYDLTRWSGAEIHADLARCDDLLRGLLRGLGGGRPRGFRAPGYTHDRRLLEQVAALGYSYDSSLLPSPTYYLAKLSMIALKGLRGRRSASMVSGWRSFVGRDRPFFRPDVGLWEMPISVLPRLRLPMVGTLVLGNERATRAAADLGYLHLELHALDLADPDSDGFDPALLRHQPELRSSLKVRRERLKWLLEERGGAATIAGALSL